MPQSIRILGISGSLRKESYSTAILRGAFERIVAPAAAEIFALNEVPLYNQDIDTDDPPAAVAALRAAIAAADGVVIASPEYNHGLSGVLKNALDWASRPYGNAPLPGKPVLTLTSSPAFTGGVRAHAQLDVTLRAIGAHAVIGPQIVIAAVHEKVRDGRLVDADALKFIENGLSALLRASAPAPDRAA